MTAPSTSSAPDALRRYRRALVGPVLLVPVGIALAGAVVLLAALPALPPRVLLHWGAGGTASGSPLAALLAVPITIALAAVLHAIVRRPQDVRRGAATRFVVAVPVWVACFLSIGLVGTVVLQAQPGAPVPWLPLLVGAGVGLVAGAVVAWTVPEPPRTDHRREVVHVEVAAGERLAWFGTATTAPSVLAGVLVVLGVAAVTVLLAAFATVPLVGLVGLVPLAAAVLAASVLSWRVRIDRAGVTATGALGFPRIRVPEQEVADVLVTTVAPLGDFGGFGLRRRPGATAVATRGGEAIEVVRRNGERLLITLDGAAEAAGVARALLLTAGERPSGRP